MDTWSSGKEEEITREIKRKRGVSVTSCSRGAAGVCSLTLCDKSQIWTADRDFCCPKPNPAKLNEMLKSKTGFD